MTKPNFHEDCIYYIEEYDECRQFHESNMSKRSRLCEGDGWND